MRRIIGIILLCLLFSATAMADSLIHQSATKTASALITTGACAFHGLVIVTDGVDEVTVDGYDALSATGTKLFPTLVVTTSSTDRIRTIDISPPLKCYTGIYINVTVAGGGSVSYMAYYTK